MKKLLIALRHTITLSFAFAYGLPLSVGYAATISFDRDSNGNTIATEPLRQMSSGTPLPGPHITEYENHGVIFDGGVIVDDSGIGGPGDPRFESGSHIASGPNALYTLDYDSLGDGTTLPGKITATFSTPVINASTFVRNVEFPANFTITAFYSGKNVASSTTFLDDLFRPPDSDGVLEVRASKIDEITIDSDHSGLKSFAIDDFSFSGPTFSFEAPFYAEDSHKVTQGPGGSTSHDEIFLEKGIDFAGGNVEVGASLAGKVNVVRDDPDFGNFITIDHGPNPNDTSERVFSFYAHLDRVLIKSGQIVQTGDIIGIEGNTGKVVSSGNGDGTHIHWDVYSGDPLAPPHPFARVPFESLPWTPLGLSHPLTGLNLLDSPGGETRLIYTQDVKSLVDQTVHSRVLKPKNTHKADTILEGQNKMYNVFVDDSAELFLQLSWPGSELGLKIIQPDETIFDFISDTDGNIEYLIPNPMSGTWSFNVSGIDLEPSGDQFTFLAETRTTVEEPGTIYLLSVAVFIFAMIAVGRLKRSPVPIGIQVLPVIAERSVEKR